MVGFSLEIKVVPVDPAVERAGGVGPETINWEPIQPDAQLVRRLESVTSFAGGNGPQDEDLAGERTAWQIATSRKEPLGVVALRAPSVASGSYVDMAIAKHQDSPRSPEAFRRLALAGVTTMAMNRILYEGAPGVATQAFFRDEPTIADLHEFGFIRVPRTPNRLAVDRINYALTIAGGALSSWVRTEHLTEGARRLHAALRSFRVAIQ